MVSNVGQKAYVLRNDGGNEQNWLAIRTVGTTIEPRRDRLPGEGRDRRRPDVQYFTVNTAAGYLSASDKRLLVGLGGESTAKLVEIRWPSGAVQTFDNVKARQTLVATEPAALERAQVAR